MRISRTRSAPVRRRTVVLALLLLGAPLLAACTSPRSVRELSADQGRRLEDFREGLAGLVDVAEADRKFNLQWRAAQFRNQLQVIELAIAAGGGTATSEQAAQRQALQKQIDETVAGTAAAHDAYASYLAYMDRVLLPGNAALDEWHRRWGVSLLDSDAVADWARAIVQTGITKDSLKALGEGLASETKAETKALQEELETVRKEVLSQKAAIEEMRRLIEELRGTPR